MTAQEKLDETLKVLRLIESDLKKLNVGNLDEEVDGPDLVDACNEFLLDIRYVLKRIGE